MVIEFNAEKHEYTIDGRRVPSVSEIIAPLSDPIIEEDDPMVALKTESAADRGITMHRYIESRLLGVPPEEIEIPSMYEGYAESVEAFLSEHEIEPYACELKSYCKSRDFAGTPDLVCSFDGAMAIVDYKFVSTIAKTRVKAQLNAYKIMMADNGFFADKLFAVQFFGDGTYRLYPVAIGTEEIDTCLKLRELKNKKHARGKIE